LRGWPLVLLAIPLLALVAVIAWVLATPDPESPATPAAPTLSTPRVAGPDIAAPTPSLDVPNVKPPGLSVPELSLPDVGGGSDHQPHSPSPPAGPEHRIELVHVHHYRWLWEFDLPLLVLFLLGLAGVRSFARLPRQGQRLFGAAVAASLIALSVAAFAAGINPQPGPGTYHREPAEIERSHGLGLEPETIVKRIQIDHFHPPIHLAVHWLLLGLALAVLAMPGARVAATRRRDDPIPGVGSVTT
jgi:hypothetical protein